MMQVYHILVCPSSVYLVAMLAYGLQWNLAQRQWLSEAIAEFFGTFLLVFLGDSAVAQKVLSEGKVGTVSSVNAGYSIAAFVGVAVAIRASGAHINPAVTVASACVGKLEWNKVPHYIVSQYLGGFLAACGVYLLYIDSFSSIQANGGLHLPTAGIFATYPRDGLSLTGGFIDQILGTFILVVAVYAITDKKNAGVPMYLVPFYVAITIFGIASSIGFNEGFAINPARDFAPRIFTYLTCWGDQVFHHGSFWFVPIIGPHIGAILGAYLYVHLIEKMHVEEGGEDVRSYSTSQVFNEKKMSVESLAVPTHSGSYKKSASISNQGEFSLKVPTSVAYARKVSMD